MRFWCQLGSIFLPKIQQNPSKTRSQDASNFGSIFRQIFHRCWLDFGGQLGAMLATFSSQEPCKTGLNTRPKRPRPPRASKTSKMTPKSRWGTPPGLVFGANMGAFGPSTQLLCHFFRGAVAGSQLCCALDPPRQALCLRMAYRVPYPNPPPLCGTAC